jgi:hypothetical protein
VDSNARHCLVTPAKHQLKPWPVTKFGHVRQPPLVYSGTPKDTAMCFLLGRFRPNIFTKLTLFSIVALYTMLLSTKVCTIGWSRRRSEWSRF